MSINERIKEIKNIFNVFDNPMDKYTQLIEIGKNCEGLLDKDKNDLNKIYGCASQAWVKTIKPPIKTIVMIKGSNQYFFLTFRKSQISTINSKKASISKKSSSSPN